MQFIVFRMADAETEAETRVDLAVDNRLGCRSNRGAGERGQQEDGYFADGVGHGENLQGPAELPG